MTKFVKGKSGNPKGRPKVSKNKTTILLAAIEDDLEKVIDVVKKQDLAGDTTSQKLLLDRLLPARKQQPITVNITEILETTTYQEKSDAIIQAIAIGNIYPEHGIQLINAIGNILKSLQLDTKVSWKEPAKEFDNIL